MIRIEHFAADVCGLQPIARAALCGQLAAEGVATHATQLHVPPDPFLPAERAQLAKWIEARATLHTPHIAVLESIRALAQPATSCIVHEVQPAILCGALEQLTGTLQTIALAQQLSSPEQTVIPMLWMRSDEPGNDSLTTSRIVNRHDDLQTVALENLGHGKAPVQSIELQATRHGTNALHSVLSQLFGDLPHATDALQLFVPRAGETLSAAFARAMYELFGEQGLVIVEPEDFREELARACADCIGADLSSTLEQSASDMQTRFAMQVNADEVWLEQVNKRTRRALFAGGDGYRFEDEPGSRTRSELAAEIVQSPRDWIPGPLLRSASRAAILPVLAEVGGEQELVRHVLLHATRRNHGWPTPSFVPRVHVTLVDEAARTALERLDLDLEDVLGNRGAGPGPEGGVDASGLVQRLQEQQREARASLAQEKRALLDLDPRLASALRSASRSVGKAFDQLVEKIDHLQGDRSGKLRRHARCLSSTLCPDGLAQETRLPAFSWVSSHGREWIHELARELDPFCAEHMLVHLD